MGLRNTFSTVVTDLVRNNIGYVETLNGLPEPVNGEIKVENLKRYITTQPINTLANKIVPATAGAQVSIVSANEIANTLTTDLTGDEPLFSGDFGRLVIQDIDIISSTGTSKLYDINSSTALRSVVIHQRSLVSGFSVIGTIDGATSIGTNIAFNGCGGGILLNNNGTGLGAGLFWSDINFIDQTGDHIKVSGNSDFISLDGIVAAPASLDRVYDLTGLTLSSTAKIGTTLFDPVNGGLLGLTQSISVDTVLANVYSDILIDTTGGSVEVILPDTDLYLLPDGYTLTLRDSGNASINRINIIPNATDGTTINNGLIEYNITESNGSVILRLSGSSWEIINRFNQKSIIALSAGSTLTEIADVITANTAGGLFTTILPTAAGRRGKFVILKKLQGFNPEWTVIAKAGEFIDNATQVRFLGASGRAATLMSDGVNWIIIEAA